jgi:hypothetical protein
MPSTLAMKNVGVAPLAAKLLVDSVSGGCQLAAAAQQGQAAVMLSPRPIGFAQGVVAPAAAGEILVTGRQTGRLKAGEAATAGQRVICAGSGLLKQAPPGYTGWIVGYFGESKTAGILDQDILVDLGCRPVT